MKVRISSEALAQIRAHQAAEPEREACGLLFGSDDRIDGVAAAENQAADPRTAFEIDGATLFAAVRAERAGGPKLVGYYHSHPNGRAEPSDTDRASAAADGKFWLIVTADAVTCWRAGADGFTPVEIG
jgi:desampylase